MFNEYGLAVQFVPSQDSTLATTVGEDPPIPIAAVLVPEPLIPVLPVFNEFLVVQAEPFQDSVADE